MEEKRISQFKELGIYTSQYIRILLSDKKNLAVSLLFPVIAAIIVVWIAGENMFVHYEGTKSGCFVIVSAAIWGGLFNSIQTIVKERSNIKRDYVTGIRLRCYTASRAIVQFVLCMIQSAILTTSYIGVEKFRDNAMPKTGIEFHNPLIEYYITILLLMYAADAMGLFISCFVKKEETANVLAPYILIVQLIFSGILFEMKGASEKVSYAMLSRWGMEGLGSICDLNSLPLKIHATFPDVPHTVENMYKYGGKHLLFVWIVLLLFALGFILVGNLVLHSVSKDSR